MRNTHFYHVHDMEQKSGMLEKLPKWENIDTAY